MTKENFKQADKMGIPYIEGDGIGPEVSAATRQVIDAAVKAAYANEKSIKWLPLLAGEKAYKQTGEWLPQKTLATLKKYPAGIKGPLQTPIGEGHTSLNVTLRQKLDLYACVRPIEFFKGVKTPTKHPERMRATVFRENTEDLYAGIEFESGSEGAAKLLQLLKENKLASKVPFPKSTNFALKPISKDGTSRLVKSAIDYALANGEKRVTLVHKGNILKKTEGSFRNWGYDVAQKQYADRVFTMDQFAQIEEKQGTTEAQDALKQAKAAGKIILDDVITDNFFQQALLNPQKFGIVATTNLNGDYISDALAAQVGGIGISPGANINYETNRALFEATHGTAPQLAGKNQANPTSLILSGVMMLNYIGWSQPAELVKQAVAKAITGQNVTADLMTGDKKPLSTREYADFICSALEQLK